MAFKRGKGGPYWVWRRQRDGGRRKISLKTRDRDAAQGLEWILKRLECLQEWDLLDAFELTTLRRAWMRNGEAGLEDLRKSLHHVDLNTQVDDWKEWAKRTVSSSAADKYFSQVRLLIPAGTPFLASDFNQGNLSRALGKLVVSPDTARRYRAAWSSFGQFLVERGVISSNPVRGIRAPRAAQPREVYLTLEDQRRLVAAQPGPFGAMAAFREGAGLEWQAVSRVRLVDIDFEKGLVRANGSKRPWRDRLAFVEPWALAHVAAYVKANPTDPHSPLFAGIGHRDALAVHQDAVHRLSLREDYRMHDSRHSIAVRWMQMGVNPQLIATNLGHKDASMVIKIYGKYQPRDVEMSRIREILGEEVEV